MCVLVYLIDIMVRGAFVVNLLLVRALVYCTVVFWFVITV